MARRMYSKNQLENIVEDKIKGFDAAIPTDLYASGDELFLFHDGKQLEPQTPVHFKQLFGKYSIFGEGNIDLYIHHIYVTWGGNSEMWVTYPSSNNLKCDSVQDLNTLFAGDERDIQVSGMWEDSDAQNGWTMDSFTWKGSMINSILNIHQDANADTNNATFTNLGLTIWEIKDVVQAI